MAHTVLTENEEAAHHAIIDLYETEDFGEVTVYDVVATTDLTHGEAQAAMNSLKDAGIIQYGTDGIVIYADNLDYYPSEMV